MPADHGFYLVRYSADAEFAGDTWHATLDDAKKQAEFEYGERLGAWRILPDDAADPVRSALARVAAD